MQKLLTGAGEQGLANNINRVRATRRTKGEQLFSAGPRARSDPQRCTLRRRLSETR
jgi:hypothetical protein